MDSFFFENVAGFIIITAIVNCRVYVSAVQVKTIAVIQRFFYKGAKLLFELKCHLSTLLKH
jgi:hypothetical protein